MKTRPYFTCIMAAAAVMSLTADVRAQSLWHDNGSRPMFADKRALGIGDILTVIVQETTTTSKDNKTATSKSSGVNASISSLFYPPSVSPLLTKGGNLPAVNFSSKSDFTGGGTVADSENIIARVGVTIVDVLPNKNFVIEGRRETAFSGEQQTIVLRGIIRPDNIASDNTIFSYNIADARVQIVGKGVINDSQRKGWFHRLFDKFSPI
ncbi:MAG TPA: flagellar basal body L-ring protein FlgH [Verrucomicrobiae bacterium]|nr:flagellar basal body L-ring protein FlgH [Verrucomicrobiae bacterium]